MKTEEIIKTIQKYKLQPATERKMPLFTLSCIGHAYTELLKQGLGFSYNAIGALGMGDFFHTLLNEKDVAEKTEKYIEKNFNFIISFSLFRKTKKNFLNCREAIDRAVQNKKLSSQKVLQIIAKEYPQYMAVIGIYNCFWRYIGNNEQRGKLTKKWVQKISQERDLVARYYPKVEELLKFYINSLGKEKNIDGDLLRYMTVPEFNLYLRQEAITKKTLKNLRARRSGYLYLFFDNQELIFTDKMIIKKIKEKFFTTSYTANIVKGYSVFPGKAQGIVYNLKEKKHLPRPDKFIIIAPSTHPDDLPLIRQAAAIVTDEGGLLCHAAIIARELHKPCVIGTKIATKIFRNGERVEVDANQGVVKKL
ncbi:hypothetical protein COU01_00040 [Candidatus Falkowbacteria bacterium CG10_big_fil_rev_8_21_14_0_10_44_15]|uniref:PEP-utilising enzyme mobile domain-containing protein n=1 Tax=Candidatus Falkowbacteria bacterium CG10_big_fil_rev_8_21_14_0_10_44_15 TaxID=1974569 RepID=A0A2H0V0Y1_9BACT|nr:MAG: hypothetical protein COU01_00040 [Candidatus Falkowbacteria bacterium CG10_big_fil_rev_8_21_14_0_10_44_15]